LLVKRIPSLDDSFCKEELPQVQPTTMFGYLVRLLLLISNNESNFRIDSPSGDSQPEM